MEAVIEKLPGEGDVEVITRTRRRHECHECCEPATRRHTFLLTNARNNRASAGYGHDSTVWCADAEAFSCEEHAEQVRRNTPDGMNWCATFDGAAYPHMLLYWHTAKASE